MGGRCSTFSMNLRSHMMAAETQPMYSLVVPIFNDGYLAEDFCAEMRRVFREFLNIEDLTGRLELIFVDDGSRDHSYQQLCALCRVYPFAKVIRLSRNFGQHIALSCGYRHAAGRYVGMLNVDGEDPIEEIPRLLRAIAEDEYDIVSGLRRNRRGPWAERLGSLAFNYVLNRLTGYAVPLNVATLRVMNRRFLDAYNQLSERQRFLPGLEQWLGFRHGYVEIEHRPRKRGRSSYSTRSRFGMAFSSILSFSDLPLRIAAYFGLIVTLIGFLLGMALAIAKLLFIDFKAGWASTVAAVMFLGGTEILVTGMLSLYVGRVLREVQQRPLYLIMEKCNF
jgi:glycosyltransferase involved in cell wall biosynthesis